MEKLKHLWLPPMSSCLRKLKLGTGQSSCRRRLSRNRRWYLAKHFEHLAADANVSKKRLDVAKATLSKLRPEESEKRSQRMSDV